MKKVIIASLFAASLAPAFSHAADGTLSFTGTVQANTCALSTGTTQSVPLQTVQVGSLASDGQQSIGKNFNVELKSCGDTAKPVRLEFLDTTNVNTGTGRLKNTATGTGAATNVEIALRASQTETTNMKLGTPSAVTATVQSKADGTAVIPMSAVYVATGGQATTGSVSTSVQFTIGYP